MYLNIIQQKIHDLSIFVTFKYVLKKILPSLNHPSASDDKDKRGWNKTGVNVYLHTAI